MRAHSDRRDRGQASLEYLAFLPILLLIALGALQLGWVAYVEQQAENAARAAARTAAKTGDAGEGQAAGEASIRESIRDSSTVSVSVGSDAVTATVTIQVGSIVPGVGGGPQTRTAVMPNDDPNPEGP